MSKDESISNASNSSAFISIFGIFLAVCVLLKKKFMLMLSAILLAISSAFGFIYAKNRESGVLESQNDKISIDF